MIQAGSYLCLLLGLLTFTLGLQADVSHKSEGQVGFTSNANFESANEDSDWYLAATQFANWSAGSGRVSLKGKLSKFVSEDHNDSFLWRTNYSVPVNSASHSDLSLWGSVFGLHFLNGAPATTEANFDYLGGDLGAEFVKDLASAELAFGGYYQLKSFHSFDGRLDHLMAGFGELLYSVSSWKLIPSTELGYANSTLGDYSRFYLSLGLHAEFSPRGLWSYSGDYLYLMTQFTSRTITQTTAISRGRGQTIMGSVQTHEAHSFSQLELAAIRKLSEMWKFSGGFKILSQNSKSGIEDYSVFEIFALVSSSY